LLLVDDGSDSWFSCDKQRFITNAKRQKADVFTRPLFVFNESPGAHRFRRVVSAAGAGSDA
jgi:hypothetical protein